MTEMEFDSPAVQLILHGLIDRRQWYGQAGLGVARLASAIHRDMLSELEKLLAKEEITILVADGDPGVACQVALWCRANQSDGLSLIAEYIRNENEDRQEDAQ